jgi:pimeloyl-ACP methyl ester carboxylesterase
VVNSRRVRAPDGTDLAVYESGSPAGSVIVAIHGYPDNHHVWDGVAAELGERYRLVTYDVRGAGASGKPSGRAAYRIERLVDDLVAVLDGVDARDGVHLLGHDWGSIQAWPALADPRLRGRVRSFTSISGPSLDHAAAYLRDFRSHPRETLRQLARSYYIALFQLPVLPELAARSGRIDNATRRLAGPSAYFAQRTAADSRHGIELYRANVFARLGRPKPERIDIPVQVLAPRRDPHVTVALQTEAPLPYVADLRAHVLDGGHWIVAQRPDVIAHAVDEFVKSQRNAP